MDASLILGNFFNKSRILPIFSFIDGPQWETFQQVYY